MKKASLLEKALKHHRAGRLDEAVKLYDRILEAQPDHVDALHLLGLVHQRRGRLEAAAASFQHVLENDPTHVRAAYALAEVLFALGRPGDAIPVLEKTLAVSPDDARLHGLLGDAWHARGDLARAAATYQRAVALDPGMVRAWWGLGCAESSRREHASAVESFRHVVQLAPNYGEAHHNLGKSLFELGQVDPALDGFREAVRQLEACELPLGMIATAIPGSQRSDHRAVLEARRAWAARFAPTVAGQTFSRPPSSSAPRLRVGYVSAFFQDRNWMKPVWGLVNHHDRERFEVHLFSDAPASAVQHGYVRDERDRFHEVSRLTNAELAPFIEEQAIDILVDLNGYSRLSRLPLFSLRPAPVLVAWFNMYATSGMDCFDYLIGDQHVFAIGEETFYRERVVSLPGCYLTFEVTYPVPEVAPAPSLERGALTFGCLAPQYKITTEVVEAWSGILHGSPGSRLLLKNVALGSAANRRFVQDLFARFGVPGERLDLDGPAEHFEFLKKYGEIDIALDTFPYNGGTTTMEALWQGVPVLTFYGDRWASRISASLMRNAGLPEFVAADLDDYVNRAMELGRAADTPTKIGTLRGTMRERLCQAPVCDVAAFARDMEQEYLRMWHA
jgi:predicted O-linked N-acetylglucosamine transferase (SPINDLY family)